MPASTSRCSVSSPALSTGTSTGCGSKQILDDKAVLLALGHELFIQDALVSGVLVNQIHAFRPFGHDVRRADLTQDAQGGQLGRRAILDDRWRRTAIPGWVVLREARLQTGLPCVGSAIVDGRCRAQCAQSFQAAGVVGRGHAVSAGAG